MHIIEGEAGVLEKDNKGMNLSQENYSMPSHME